MNKLIKDNNRSIFIFLLLSVFFFAGFFSVRHVLNENFDMMDYIWNYSFSEKIRLGYIPYRDFHLLQTPLSFYITSVFLFVFSKTYYVYALMGAFFISFMYFLLFKVTFKIANNINAATYVSFICLVFTIPNLMIYNYNILSVIIVLAILLLELGEREKIKNNIFIGFLLGFLFLTKQNISAGIVLSSYFFIFLSQDVLIKEKIKFILVRSVGGAVPVIIYCIYLYVNNGLYDFIDHTFLGLIDFQQDNTFSFPLIEFLYFLLPLFMVLRAIYRLITQKSRQFNDRLLIVTSYAIGMFFVLYPLFDLNHIGIASVVSFLLLPVLYKPENLVFSPLSKVVFLAILPTMLVYHIVYLFVGNFTFFSLTENYKHTVVHQEQLKHISTVLDYVKKSEKEGNPVVILDTRAMAYWSMLGINNNPFDFLVGGNMGYQGESKALVKMRELNAGTRFMISDSSRMQEMNSLRIHAICHYQLIDKISMYYVYQKPMTITDNSDCVRKLESNNDIINDYIELQRNHVS